jgi:hypothetical protein
MNPIVRASVLLLLFVAPAGASEIAVKRADLPAAVRKAVDQHYPSAQHLGYSREREDGRLLYEAEMKVAGRHVDASFDSLGALVVEEAEIPVKEIPAAVRDSLAKSVHAKGTIERVEKVTETGAPRPPRYELVVRDGSNRYEMVFESSGARVSEEKVGRND